MTKVKVNQIFASAFETVTKTLVAVELQQADHPVFEGEKTYKETVHTKGALDSFIVCEFSATMFEAIVKTMYGGEMPPDPELPLYINEYINIVCGRAVSALNNETNTKTRLSVPSFYTLEESICEEQGKENETKLFYMTKNGRLQVSINYNNMEIS